MVTTSRQTKPVDTTSRRSNGHENDNNDGNDNENYNGENHNRSSQTESSLSSSSSSSVYNPGWEFTAIIVILCVLINATLPLWLKLGRRRRRRRMKEQQRQKKKQDERESTTHNGEEGEVMNDDEAKEIKPSDSNVHPTNLSKVEVILDDGEDSSSPSSSSSSSSSSVEANALTAATIAKYYGNNNNNNNKSKRRGYGQNHERSSPKSTTRRRNNTSDVGFEVQVDDDDNHGNDDDDDDDDRSELSSTQSVMSMMLQFRPKRLPGCITPRDLLHINRKKKNQNNSTKNGETKRSNRSHIRNNEDDDADLEEEEGQNIVYHSFCLGSRRRQLGDDMNDTKNPVNDNKDDNVDDDDDLLNSSNDRWWSWCCCGYTLQQCYDGWDHLLEVVTYEREMKKLISLAVPFVLQGLTTEFFDIVNVAIIGHFVGQREQNAFIVVTVLLELTSTLTQGFSESVGILVPHANGAGNKILVGRYLQLGMIFYTIFTIPGVIIWSLYTYDAVLWFGYDTETAEIGQQYAWTALAYLFLLGAEEVLGEFLNTLEHERYATIYRMSSSAIHTCMIVLLTTAGKVTNLLVIGLAQVSFYLLSFSTNVMIITYQGWFDSYWRGLFSTFSFSDRVAVRTVFVTAVPLGIAWLLTYGEWEMMTFFAASMGPSAVTAWTLLGYVWSCFETVTDGLGDAGETRVGFRMGAGHIDTAKLVSAKAIYLGVVVGIFDTSILFIIARYLPSWLTPNPVLQQMIFELLPLVGFGQILMVAGMVAWAILCAQGRVKLATAIEFAISWGVGIPAAAIFVYPLGYNLEGMVAALVIAYTIGANIYLYVYANSDWTKLSDAVRDLNVAEGTRFDDFDWDDLPDAIRDSAIILGYDQDMWDNDKDPPTAAKVWNDLSQSEQNAATQLGYTKRKWNDETSSDDDDDDGNDDDIDSPVRDLPYDKMDWSELPVEARQAAKTLGYSKEIWDSQNESVPCEEMDWNELTSNQRHAASILGYSESTWNEDQEFHDCSNNLIDDEVEVEPSSIDHIDWHSLEPTVRRAAEVLGYTEAIWNSDREPLTANKDWHELTEKEQQACVSLGYTPSTWNANEDDEEQQLKTYSTSNTLAPCPYEVCKWDDLPSDVRHAAIILKYNRRLWDNDNEPSITQKTWIELTEKERAAASVLGYNQHTWDYDGVDRPKDEVFVSKVHHATHGIKENGTNHFIGSILGCSFDTEQSDDSLLRNTNVHEHTPPSTGIERRCSDSSSSLLDQFNTNVVSLLGIGNVPMKDKSGGNTNVHINVGGHPALEETSSSDSPKVDYSDYDWHELPHYVRNAAKTLGYTKRIWNNDHEPSLTDKSWSELSLEQRLAAHVLGYNAVKWDEED